MNETIGVGVISVANSLSMAEGWFEGYEMDDAGQFFAKNRHPVAGFGEAARYGVGDEVTVRLNLDANTVAFSKNGVTVGTPQDIPNDSYYFMFESVTDDDVVTIVEMQ